MQSWFILIAAIVLEVAGTTAMKFSNGFTRPLPSALLVAIVGVLWFKVPATLLKVASIMLIAARVAGLHLSSTTGGH